ncbi:hypothetical protein CHS0354_034033 [Potamilus streckersoni]|uniref:Casein kinase substrate phosphoprotein PP28 domain-containing protein n=1 Tax=Potamilus streckersoni TaxID=2493646 RepID=A0AAE0RMU0_9BIVA|nr:hypothetical protein CHS0354_034033 [Potamilus streckersoni]
MPRGGARGKTNFKGKRRVFTNEEDLQTQLEKEERERKWREQRGELGDSDKEGEGATAKGSGSEESESDSDDDESKHKGVEHLIEIENPNRTAKKNKKVTEIEGSEAVLTRREREELEKQQAKQRYQQLHLQGKTDEAQADLARLAIIRKQREEAAKKRDEEKRKADEAAAKTKSMS